MSKKTSQVAVARGVLRVNRPEATVLFDFAKICEACSEDWSKSPMDIYLVARQELIAQAIAPTVSDELRALFVMELVGSVELYFRQIITRVVHICPISRLRIGTKTLPFGAVAYYDAAHLPRAIIEHAPFSNAAEIIKQTKAILEIDLANVSSMKTALEDFSRVCNVRHAIAHSRGRLGSNNLSEMGVRGLQGLQKVRVSSQDFQDMAAICQSTARAYNQCVFEGTLRVWLREGLLTGAWISDEQKFSQLYHLFWSIEDNGVADAQRDYAALSIS